MWVQAEYPNEDANVIVFLTPEEVKVLEQVGKDAEENDMVVDFELLPHQPITFDTFMELYGEDFAVEEDPA